MDIKDNALFDSFLEVKSDEYKRNHMYWKQISKPTTLLKMLNKNTRQHTLKLFCKIMKGDENKVKNMLKERFYHSNHYLNFDNNVKLSLLTIATIKGLFDTVESMINMGWNVNDNDGKTSECLLHACQSGYYHIAKILLSSGANPKSSDSKYSAIQYAIMSKNKSLIKLLTSHILQE